MTHLFLDLEPPDGGTSPLGKLLGILDQCVSLEECTLCLREDPDLAPLPHVRLQHLQSLHIQIIFPSETSNRLDEFLDVTDFPSLSSLDVTYRMPSGEPMTFPERLNPFLRRHSSLRRFVFATPSWYPGVHDFLKILEGISSMTELHVHLHRAYSIAPLVEALTPVLHEGSFSCLLPHLEILTLRWNKLKSLSCIIEMVEMRYAPAASLHGIAQLKCITFRAESGFWHEMLWGDDEYDICYRLDKLRARGLTVRFLDTNDQLCEIYYHDT
jgi:hypothetical protein